MNFGIYDININSSLDYTKRLEIYKTVGFGEIGLYLDDRYMAVGENYRDIILYAKSIGLKIHQVHADYKNSDKICDESTEEYFEYMEKKINECINFGIKNIVFHASLGVDMPKISNNQLNKLRKTLEKFEKYNINVCFENVRNNVNLDLILNSKIPCAKMCFDLGHAYCYDNVDVLFEKYKTHIACTHLHNNQGTDLHDILTDGDIDYKSFLNKLKSLENCDNCLECFPDRSEHLSEIEFVNFVQKCYNSVM